MIVPVQLEPTVYVPVKVLLQLTPVTLWTSLPNTVPSALNVIIPTEASGKSGLECETEVEVVPSPFARNR